MSEEAQLARLQTSPHALWLWGRLNDFEHDGMLKRDQAEVLRLAAGGKLRLAAGRGSKPCGWTSAPASPAALSGRAAAEAHHARGRPSSCQAG